MTNKLLLPGEYFGEQALLPGGTQLRTANVISLTCECLVLDKTSFVSLIGDLNEIRAKHYEDDQAKALKEARSRGCSVSRDSKKLFEITTDENDVKDLTLDDLTGTKHVF